MAEEASCSKIKKKRRGPYREKKNEEDDFEADICIQPDDSTSDFNLSRVDFRHSSSNVQNIDDPQLLQMVNSPVFALVSLGDRNCMIKHC